MALNLTILLGLRGCRPCRKYWKPYVTHLMKDLVFFCENMEVRNAVLQALRLSKMYTILNSQVWGRDYITGQRTVQKLGKQIDEIDEFICNHFLDLLPLQNLNVMHTSVL